MKLQHVRNLRQRQVMIRYHVRWALLLTLLCVLPVALIRAQPYDDHDLRAFLTPPEGCPAPCFMGIRPGVTTAEEAIAILENHEWIAKVYDVDPSLWEDPDGEGLNFMPIINWEWNGTQPEWIQQQYGGTLWVSRGLVSSLTSYTSFSMGDILLTLGVPDKFQITSHYNMFGHVWEYDGWYAGGSVWFTVSGFCPLHRSYIYSGQTTATFWAIAPEFYGPSSFDGICKD